MKRRDMLKAGLVTLLAQPGAALFARGIVHWQSKDVQKALPEFASFYRASLQEHGIVGSSFMLIRDHEVIVKEFYGLANIEQKRSVDENTIYHWASITKTFTGIAIMQLRDRGRLKLDDPIIKYIPELRGVHNPFGDMSEITIKHLMTHSSGFRAPTWPWGGDKPWHPHEPLHWEQLVAMIPYTEILFKPGSKFSYSNPGIIFLGRVIELLTTDDYEVYIDKNIFKPLEMYRSYFDTTPYHLMKHKCQSYNLEKGKLTPDDPDVNTGITVSNGGLNAPLTDMVKYLDFLMGNPKKKDVFDLVLKRPSLEEMFQPQIGIEPCNHRPGDVNRKDAMGLIFFIEDNHGMRFVGHSGSQNAFVTHFYLNLATQTSYLVAYNTLVYEDKQNTGVMDSDIKLHLFKNLFPLASKTT